MRGILLVNSRGTALIDDADYELVSKYRWYLVSGAAAARTDDTGRLTLMHRFLLNAQPAERVDHKNRNRLDNTRENLRKCTLRQNSANRIPRNRRQYRGVEQTGPHSWAARIFMYLGSHPSPDAAARAYDEAARQLHGEFARLNFPKDGEQSAVA